MVPTLEAIITLQMLYSAVPPIGTASARLAMLPPVKSDPLATVCAGRSQLSARPRGTLHLTSRFPSFESPCDSPLGCEPRLQWRKGALECTRSYTGRRWLSRNDLARNQLGREPDPSAIQPVFAEASSLRALADQPHS